MNRTGLRQTSLSYVALRTPDSDAAKAFYMRALGLVEHASPQGSAVRLGWGQGHHALELEHGAAGLCSFGLEVLDEGGYEAVAAQLTAAGYSVTETSAWRAGVEVRDPDGNLIRLHGAVDRSGEFTADSGRRPIRVQHVTLSTAQMAPMVAFYETMGFTVSDRMGGRFTWLRCSRDHHVVAIVMGEHECGLDHYSYDLAGWDDFKSWCDRMADIGVRVQWGPGRHGPGNNLFVFVDDADGNHVELSAEMERFWDDRVAYGERDWSESADTINLWGGQLASWRNVE